MVSVSSKWNQIILWQQYSQERREGKTGYEKKKIAAPHFGGFFLVCPSSPLSLWSAVKGLSWHLFIFKMLDCNLHRSLWSSCMDVPVPESEPRSGGWGRGGRGASCGLHFLWRENPARLSQEWNLKALSQCCLLFGHQVLLEEGNTVSFLEPGSLWNISQNLLRIYLPNSPCVMDHSCWSESALDQHTFLPLVILSSC